MTRAVMVHVSWTVQPDREPDAKASTYSQECDLCGLGSPRGLDPADGTLWILEHVRTNPSHLSYTEMIKRPWRAHMNA